MSINLLPWREASRYRLQKKCYVFLSISIVIGILTMTIVHFIIAHRIDSQEKNNFLLQKSMENFDKRMEEVYKLKQVKITLSEQIKFAQKLKLKRKQVIQLFSTIVKILPKNISLTKVVRQQDQITLEGIAESTEDITLLMRNIERIKWLKHSSLNEIKSDNRNEKIINQFILQLFFSQKEEKK